MKVKDVMTVDVVTVRPGTPLKEVASILAERHISGLPVVGDDGALLGVVSEGDILFKEAAPAEHKSVFSWLLDPYEPQATLKLEARTALEAMSAPPVTIGPKRPVSEAAAKMLDEGVNRLPVVNEAGELIGIVTRADLVRAFIRPDAAIAEEIREDVALRTLWLAPQTLTVKVNAGEVQLDGTVDTKTDAELLEQFAAKVPGVVSVHSDLGWIDDD